MKKYYNNSVYIAISDIENILYYHNKNLTKYQENKLIEAVELLKRNFTQDESDCENE